MRVGATAIDSKWNKQKQIIIKHILKYFLQKSHIFCGYFDFQINLC